MRFTELAAKEIINLTNGGRLGPIGDTDLLIDPASGQIQSMLVPPRGRWAKHGQHTEIAWSAIRRVGPEVLIVDLEAVPLMRNSGRN
ncbi:MAG: YlmC/YmxH family sporulation protein [Thermaerobacter sp.]|nr:YlmC/YmxH family sporulation protein [Thermaerobacter sp.]